MNNRFVETKASPSNGENSNEGRINYAKQVLEEMAIQVSRTRQNGTIGIEIPVKDGKLGKVKRMSITFQRE